MVITGLGGSLAGCGEGGIVRVDDGGSKGPYAGRESNCSSAKSWGWLFRKHNESQSEGKGGDWAVSAIHE